MKINGNRYEVGQRVKICNIVDPGKKMQDRNLNGRFGSLSPKFRGIPFGDVGIYLEPLPVRSGQRPQPVERINILKNEFEVV